MKTQINTLINGCKNIIRDIDDAKYINAPQAKTSLHRYRRADITEPRNMHIF